jgi:hypothetical protein
MSYLGNLQEPPPKKASTGKRILVGCAIGCGSLILLTFAGCFGFAWYVSRPGKAIDPYAMLSDKSTAFLRADINLEDAGQSALLRKLIELQGTRELQGAPEEIKGIFRSMRQQPPDQQIQSYRQFLGLQAVVVAEPGKDGKDDFFVVVSVRKFARLWGMLFGLVSQGRAKGNVTVQYNGRTIVQTQGGEGHLACVGNHLVFGRSSDMVRAGIDRVKAAEAGPVKFAGSPAMKAAIQSLNSKSDLVLGITNETGTLGRLIERMRNKNEPAGLEEFMTQVLELPPSDVGSLAADVDVQTEQTIVANVRLKLQDPAKMPVLRDRLNYILTTIANDETVAASGLILRHEAREEADSMLVKLEFGGVSDCIKKSAEKQRKKAAGRPETPVSPPNEGGKRDNGAI